MAINKPYIGIGGLLFTQDEATGSVAIAVDPEAGPSIVVNASVTQALQTWLTDAIVYQGDLGITEKMGPVYDKFGKVALQEWLLDKNGVE